MLEFGRLITAMVTPFNEEGALDIDEAVRIADHLVQTGTETLLLSGTTGESPTLAHSEERLLFTELVRQFGGTVKIMAGTGSNATQTAVESSRAAESIGVDGLLQVVPYYNKPSQEGIFRHFSAVAESTALPILLYNIPGRTGTTMSPETVARLAEKETIIGLKEAAGSLDQFKAIRKATPDSFLMYSGDDALTLSFMKAGGAGVVSVASHCAGQEIVAMMRAVEMGDLDGAQAIHDMLSDLFRVLFITSNPAPVKAALALMGFNQDRLRLPLISVTDDERQKIKAALTPLMSS